MKACKVCKCCILTFYHQDLCLVTNSPFCHQLSFLDNQTPATSLETSIGTSNMAIPSSALSRTLQSITITKIGELEKQRKAFDRRKNEILALLEEAGDDRRGRAHLLLSAVAELDPSSSSEAAIHNIHNWLYQS
jgi:hypothetical protein